MNRLLRSITNIETALASVCLAASTILIVVAAIARTVSRPINWSLDISLFLFAWATFLAADVAFRDDRLVSVDVIVQRLPPHPARVVNVILHVLILVFLVSLIILGFILAYRTRQRSFQGIPSVSYSWVTLSLPVGAAMLAMTTVGKLVALLRQPSQPSR